MILLYTLQNSSIFNHFRLVGEDQPAITVFSERQHVGTAVMRGIFPEGHNLAVFLTIAEKNMPGPKSEVVV